MKARSLVLSLMVGLLAPVAVPPPSADAAPKKAAAKEPDASQIADRVQAFYNNSRTFKSGFKQRYVVRAYNKQKDSSGQVIFAKPGKMSWRYTSNGNRVVSDGRPSRSTRRTTSRCTSSRWPRASTRPLWRSWSAAAT